MEELLGLVLLSMFAGVIVTLRKNVKRLKVCATVAMGLILLVVVFAGIGINEDEAYIEWLESSIWNSIIARDGFDECIEIDNNDFLECLLEMTEGIDDSFDTAVVYYNSYHE